MSQHGVPLVMLGRVVAHASPARLTKKKAKQILREGTARGQVLTEKQKGLFGLIAGGGRPSRKKGFKG